MRAKPSRILYFLTLATTATLGLVMSERVSRVMALGACWALASFLLDARERRRGQGATMSGSRRSTVCLELHPLMLAAAGAIAFVRRDDVAAVLITSGIAAGLSTLLDMLEGRASAGARSPGPEQHLHGFRDCWRSPLVLAAVVLVAMGGLCVSIPDDPGAVTAAASGGIAALLLLTALGLRDRRHRLTTTGAGADVGEG
ncbi:hypothetical protein [Clavibacter nebraskensis]|uniref:hypothetical protein n=1 Tax=Clavibacter nebraskensis TaxID=31963 RepID=UPI001F42E469|nr:hypothetical protein [Clavibacter nebraskensis]UKF28307.1 hypothetical protein FGQ65_08880 [Clavibacter nebraskensis]UQB16506.1 hypothetical protein LIX22_000175 [Clavibacter nebraskensis]